MFFIMVKEKDIKLPSGLRYELLNYAVRNGFSLGQILRKGEEIATNRVQVTPYITRLGTAGGVPESKGNVNCNQEMYRAMRVRIENGISPSKEQRHKSLIEQESLEIGWAEA